MQSIKKHVITNACPEDYENIYKLFISTRTQHFGRHRRKDTLADLFFTNSNVSHRLVIPITAAKHIIIGYAEVASGPNMPALPNASWPELIHFHYCCNLPLNATNTCFLNRYVYHKDYNPQMLKQLLVELFHRDNKLKYVLILESPNYVLYPGKGVQNYSCLKDLSTVFYPKCFSVITCPITSRLHVIMRETLLPQMRYRRALAQDNDDIVEIVHQDNPHLKERWGDYYIAEELASNSQSLLIVTEIDQLTAGLIWLDEHIELLPLLENYNLQTFGNLLKFNARQRFKEKRLLVNAARRRPLEKCFAMDASNQNLMCGGEVENASNYSLFDHQMETDDENEKCANLQQSISMRLQELHERLKSSSYYVQLHKRQFAFYYNIPDGETNAPWDAQSNVFAIQLLALQDSYDARQAFEYLATAFAAFPGKDYCLLSYSSIKETTPLFLEILKYFIPVNLRPNCYVGEHLFITHRCAVYGDVSLVAVRRRDANDIVSLLKQEFSPPYPAAKRASEARNLIFAESDSYEEAPSYRHDLGAIKAILQRIFQDPFSDYKCFTIRCGDSNRSVDENKVVGFVMIRPFNLHFRLQKHFHNVKRNEFEKFVQAEIITLKLHPLLRFQADFIFRELARQTNYNYFYYFHSTHHHNIANDLVSSMQPLEPRRIKKLWFNYFGESAASSSANGDESLDTVDLLKDQFAVFKYHLRPTAYFGSTRNIVVVGFTDICKAFLRQMIFSWHNLSPDIRSTINCLPQLNVTVICSPGLMEAELEHSFKCNICSKKPTETCWTNFRNCDAFIRDVCERMDLRTWIRFVSCKIKSIHSDKNLIVMKSGCQIHYEELLLMCGTDYGVPQGMFHDVERPLNYSHFNNRFHKILFYHKLQLLQKTLPEDIAKSIVVYGCHLRTFEFVHFLLKHNVQASQIHLVLPRTNEYLQRGRALNNSAEDARLVAVLREMVADLGVKTYDLMDLIDYKLCDDKNILRAVTFRKCVSGAEITFECDLFVSFYEVFLPASLLNIFKASNIDTQDDFVLVNESYRTSAPNIYAVGNFIRHPEEPNHQYRFVNPEEAAEKIIHALGLIESKAGERQFSKPSYFQAQLPLDHLLVKITAPKRYLANHCNNEYGPPLVTYNGREFTRVRLNEGGMVEELVLVTKKKKNYDFLKFFCGRHELLLNHLKSRWYLKEIVSLVDFFQEPWTQLLMHDEFESLQAINRNLLLKTAQEVVQQNDAPDVKRKLLNSYCQGLGITADMEHALVEFIRNKREDFDLDIALPEDFPQRDSNAFAV